MCLQCFRENIKIIQNPLPLTLQLFRWDSQCTGPIQYFSQLKGVISKRVRVCTAVVQLFLNFLLSQNYDRVRYSLALFSKIWLVLLRWVGLFWSSLVQLTLLPQGGGHFFSLNLIKIKAYQAYQAVHYYPPLVTHQQIKQPCLIIQWSGMNI